MCIHITKARTEDGDGYGRAHGDKLRHTFYDDGQDDAPPPPPPLLPPATTRPVIAMHSYPYGSRMLFFGHSWL